MWGPAEPQPRRSGLVGAVLSVQSCPAISLDSVRRKDMCGHCPVVPGPTGPREQGAEPRLGAGLPWADRGLCRQALQQAGTPGSGRAGGEEAGGLGGAQVIRTGRW